MRIISRYKLIDHRNKSTSILLFVAFSNNTPPDQSEVSFDLSAECNFTINRSAYVLSQQNASHLLKDNLLFQKLTSLTLTTVPPHDVDEMLINKISPSLMFSILLF